MVHPIRDVHVFCPPSTPVAWHPPEASHRWQWQESTRLGAEPKHLPRDHGWQWQWVGWHERWVAWVVCCCEVAFAPVAAHAWMDGWYHRWLGMDGCHGWQWVGGEGYVPEPHGSHKAQPVLFWKCDPLQKKSVRTMQASAPRSQRWPCCVVSQTPLRAEPCRHLRQSLEMHVAAVGSMQNFEPAMVAVRLKAQHTSGISTRNLSAKDTLLTRG